ncbi:DUF1330 domain-containing protein [Flexibacterium corallicola]|uniref:DUF1330 domain-containing protein n=1 Tax=Flexibacterium corallicola TaxID=3037259 RepID=UPI00286F6E73|nr:DUF1330 domain-containing protein [Pseudovibrio sp. M1P-2-3]
MSATLLTIVSPNPAGAAAMERYQKGAKEVLGAVGITPLFKRKVVNVLNGEFDGKVVMASQFPSREVAEEVFNSEAYKALIPDRDEAFSSVQLVLLEDV